MTDASRVVGTPTRIPPRSRLLLTPGPVAVASSVRQAVARTDLGHREGMTRRCLTEVRRKLASLCGGADQYTSVLLTGSGTAALEAVLCSVTPADAELLVVSNGRFGDRLEQIAAVHKLRCTTLRLPVGRAVDPVAVQQALDARPTVTHVAMVQHETSLGVLNPVPAIARIVRAAGPEFIVDGISSIGAEQLDLAHDPVDWLVGSANKCIEALAGLSFVCARPERFESLAAIGPRSFYLDLHQHYLAQQRNDAPLFTPAVQLLLALDEALTLALDEGVLPRSARYAAHSEQVRDGLARRGLRLLVPVPDRSSSVTAFEVPPPLTADRLCDAMSAAGVVIYPASSVAQEAAIVATMGQVTTEDVDRFFLVLDETLAVLSPSGVRRDATRLEAGVY
ncbi:pyridoxal-phosphate-dependent aminotransferase family protein [Micromonospora arborensis]|uniref:pyridoxal-phosphate-dependent aminotransferase family protein n=1 Tax=Micromonospora arborensis TaxID=2116518 RepID=UPI003718B8B8